MVYESKLIIGFLLKLTEKSKSKYSLHTSHVAHQARAYPGALSIQQNHWFKFSEVLQVEWKASDRFPEFEVACSATQGILGETL